ncbi:carotenoid biosynthesis protein [Paenibacillus sp. JX-17]|uniref:Carotenoid biosynthesis protein n=1 Tax=Paenibacillus lacisoli TaxID=3064525 RepID=A0ABT9CB59_9BACL|nr:carotenoid biosynthesis protein [Paenibacillus sp. JX-17]MDO7906497.1 carotenoid biosynthesis protein [Paenibacillus sp. JX-17]
MIGWLFWIWYAIGAVLLLTVGVPDMLAFSNGLFLIFYAVYTLSLLYRGEAGFKLSDWSVRSAVGRSLWPAAAIIWLAGMGVEWIGVHTGWPFGQYGYSSILGIRLFGVPVTLGFAWIAVVGNAVLISGRFGSSWIRAICAGAGAVLLDLVLDPAAHARGFWHWGGTGGFYGVPWSNFIAWFVVGALLSLLLPHVPRDRSVQAQGVRLYQLILLLFGLLDLKAGLYGAALIALAGIVIAEGGWQYANRRQVQTV